MIKADFNTWADPTAPKECRNNIDFDSFWPDEEDVHWTPERESVESVVARGISFLKWLALRPETDIAIVTHSSFLRNLFQQFGDNVDKDDKGRLQRLAGNAELRSITLCAHAPISKL